MAHEKFTKNYVKKRQKNCLQTAEIDEKNGPDLTKLSTLQFCYNKFAFNWVV